MCPGDEARADQWLALLRQAEAQLQREQYAQAALTLRQALAIDDRPAGVWQNLAFALFQMGQYEPAAAACRAAINRQSNHAQAWNTLGLAQAALGRHADAEESFRQAIACRPGYARAQHNLANALEQLGRVDEATAAYREALRCDAGQAESAYELAALGAAPAPDRAPAAYVARLFDAYAERFERHLVEELEYHTPEKLVELARQAGLAGSAWVVDLGCGTGLVGPLVRQVASRLVGVDLSPRMLAQAASKHVYDELVQADLFDWLSGATESFDAVFAADVLIYTGELASLFRLVCARLAPRGLFAFSIELGMAPGFRLGRGRRYVHNLPYVRQAAHAAGLSIAAERQDVLRLQDGQPCPGVLMVCRAGGE